MYTTSVTLALTAGTVAGVAAYQSQLDFTPSDEKRELQNNQILFPMDDTEKNKKDSNATEKDKSALWEQNQKDTEEVKKDDIADFLFDSAQSGVDDASDQVALVQDPTLPVPDSSQDTTGTTKPDQIYDITDDKTKADTIITDPNRTPDNTQTPGNGDTTKPDNTGTDGTAGGNGKSDDDSNSSKDDGKDNTNSGDNGNKGDTGDDNKPVKRPASTAKDPSVSVSDKEIPDTGYWDAISKPITDKDVSKDLDVGTDNTHACVLYIGMPLFSLQSLYEGKEITEADVFCALDTYIYSIYDNTVIYFDADSYGTYFKVDSVSFDAGDSWVSTFPVTIPTDMEDESAMRIRVSWRSNPEGKWTQETVPYAVKKSRVFILKEEIKNENQEITADDVINWNDFYVGQYPDVGNTYLLTHYYYQEQILGEGEGRITQLFPGWVEDDGKPFWKYTITGGRHILEPAAMVPLDDTYIVEKKMMWLDDDMNVGNGYNYSMLQTLTGLEDESDSLWSDGSVTTDKLSVPKYVQAVDIDWSTPVTVDTLELPDTVIYVNTGSPAMMVKKAYVVDADNEKYTSDEQGVLWNKEKTQILGIPYDLETLVVPAGTEKVQISWMNQLKKIVFEAGAEDTFPEINLDYLSDCQIEVHDEALFTFFESLGTEATNNGLGIFTTEDPETFYTVKSGMALDQNNGLRYVFSTTGANFTLPDGVETVAEKTFCNAAKTSTLILQKGQSPVLEKDSLTNSHVRKIICATQEQFDDMTKQLEVAGTVNADGDPIEIQMSAQTSDGFTYYEEETDGVTQRTLVGVPKDLSVFDGTIEHGTLTVDEIGDSAFVGSSVTWVTLPEETTKIGFSAFKGCEQLQGVLINAKDSIVIGDQAFDDCPALRFVASNAMHAEMENGYDPMIADMEYYSPFLGNTNFFVLPDADGYGTYTNSMGETTGIASYTMLLAGDETDCRILYGVDEEDTAWAAIRSGKTVPEQVKLPATTRLIGDYSFADTTSPSGSFTVNWEDFKDLYWLQDGAFENAGLSGEIVLGQATGWIRLDQSVFQNCASITGIEIKSMLTSLGAFTFSDCSSLEKVVFHELGESATLESGLFNSCDVLKEVHLETETPPELIINWNGPFVFNGNWTQEEEDNLKIIVPETAVEDYVIQWRYAFGGYVTTLDYMGYYTPAFRYLWMDAYNELGGVPSNKEVDALVKSKLLTLENHVRRMLGTATVTEPTNLYIWHQNGDQLALGEVPSNVKHVTLDPLTLDMPEEWFLDSVESGAFAGADDLQSVTCLENLVSIEKDAFKGSAKNSEKLTLNFAGTSPLQLLNWSKDDPFSFGVSDDKLKIQVPEGSEEEYIKSWVYPMSGYADEAEVLAEAEELVKKEGSVSADTDAVDEKKQQDTQVGETDDPVTVDSDTDSGDTDAGDTDNGANGGSTDTVDDTEVRIRRKAAELLLPTENRLRSMMGLAKLDSIDDGMYSLDVSKLADTASAVSEDAQTEPEEASQLPESEDTASVSGLPETEEPIGTEDADKTEDPKKMEDSAKTEDSTGGASATEETAGEQTEKTPESSVNTDSEAGMDKTSADAAATEKTTDSTDETKKEAQKETQKENKTGLRKETGVTAAGTKVPQKQTGTVDSRKEEGKHE